MSHHTAEHDQLHLCGACRAEGLEVEARERVGNRFWQVTLRCSACESEGTGVYYDAEVASLERRSLAGAV